MKNHFFISYAGNKRTEVKDFYELIKDDIKDKTTIIEPYCGSCSISYYISTLHPKKYKYILNDTDNNLYNLLTIARDEEKFNKLIDELEELKPIIISSKENYNAYIKENKHNIKGYLVSHFIYYIRAGLYPINGHLSKKTFTDLKTKPIINFLRTEDITITNIDGLEVYINNKDNPDNILILDPPYLDCSNSCYILPTGLKTNIYEYLFNSSIRKEKAFIGLILENNWIIKLLFNGYNSVTYEKQYQQSKKITEHIYITNTQ